MGHKREKEMEDTTSKAGSIDLTHQLGFSLGKALGGDESLQ